MLCLECRPTDEIFSHRSPDGTERHYNASAIIRAIMSSQIKCEGANIELVPELVRHLETNHGIEEDHMDKVQARLDSPILIVYFKDGTNLIIDGSHRVVARWRKGLRTVLAAIVQDGDTLPYLVTDMPQELSDFCLDTEHLHENPYDRLGVGRV